jgi:hypothetical protein
MSAPIRRPAHPGRGYGCPPIALGLFSLVGRRPEYLFFPSADLSRPPVATDRFERWQRGSTRKWQISIPM